MYSELLYDPYVQVNCEDIENGVVTYSIKDGRNIMYSGGGETKERFYDVLAGGVKADFYGVYQ